MKINIKFTDLEPDDKLRDYTLTKVESFGKLIGEEELAASVCDVEYKKDTHHQKGDVCYAEVTLEVAGNVYRASKHEKTHEKGIDKVKDDILQSLRVDKHKRQHNFLKGAQQIKAMTQGEA